MIDIESKDLPVVPVVVFSRFRYVGKYYHYGCEYTRSAPVVVIEVKPDSSEESTN